MGKRGPKGKGPRKEVRARVPIALAAAVDAAADESPYADRNEYLTALLAEVVGQPQYKPTPKIAQEELPLKTA